MSGMRMPFSDTGVPRSNPISTTAGVSAAAPGERVSRKSAAEAGAVSSEAISRSRASRLTWVASMRPSPETSGAPAALTRARLAGSQPLDQLDEPHRLCVVQ